MLGGIIWGWVNFLIALLLFGTQADTIFVAAGMRLTAVLVARTFAGDAN